MARRRNVRQVSKYEAEKVHISTTVKRIEEQNVLVNDKYKTVFYCESANGGEGKMCIAWGRTVIVEGSKVELDGRFKDDVFLVWSMKITNQIKLPPVYNPHLEEIKRKLKELNKR